MTRFLRNVSAEELKASIEEIIDDFININFTLHPKAISETANKKIRNGDNCCCCCSIHNFELCFPLR